MTTGSQWLVRGLLAVISVAVHTGPAHAQEQAVPSGAICDGSPDTVLSGLVLDLLTGAPLPGADVELHNERYGPMVLGVATTDASGAYRFCRVPPVAGLALQGRVGDVVSAMLPVPQRAVGEMEVLYLEWSAPIDVVGRVVDATTGVPLPGATVAIAERGVVSTTDGAGLFQLQGQGAGRLELVTSMLGFRSRTDTLTTVSGDRLDLTIRLAADPIELEPIEVSVRARQSEERRRVASRFDQMTRDEVDAVLPRTMDFAGLVRNARFPGMTVSERADGTVCVGTLRGGPGCSMVEVYLDGVRIQEASSLLAALDPNIVESLLYLDPFEARIRYAGPRVQNGVLLIFTRRGRRP